MNTIVEQISDDNSDKDTNFGKIDLGRWPDAAKQFGIDASATSAQLPTLILFENGQETRRLPPVKPNGDVTRVRFDREGIERVFELNRNGGKNNAAASKKKQ